MFNFGGGSSTSTSQSSSQNVGINSSSSFSDALSQAVSSSRGGSSQSVANQDILDLLYGAGVNAAGKAASAVPLLEGQAQALFAGGNKFLESLGGGVDTDYLQSRIDGSSPVLDEQIGALGDDLGKFFREELNPAITSEAVAGGTLGGGRQGVAQGRAMDMVGREFQQGATALRSQDIAARDAAAATLGQNRVAGAGTGLASLGSLFGIAQGGANAALDPVLALSQIIGGPTVLSDSFSESSSLSESVAKSLSESFGFTYGDSQSTSKSKSKSLSMGLG